MPNPIIQFRLNPYQLARGIQAIRQFDPTYKPVSFAALVKLVYTDYCAKISIGRSNELDPKIIQEVQRMIQKKSVHVKEITLEQVIANHKEHYRQQKEVTQQPLPETKTESSISVVTDFSLPEEFLREIEDDYNDNED